MIPQWEINRREAYDTWHYQQSNNTSQSLPFLGGLTSGSMLATAGLSTRTIVGIGAVSGGGFDVAGQYVETNGFTTGKYRWEQTAVATVTGGWAAPYAVSYGALGNMLLGSGVSVVNAEFGNLYYQGDGTFTQKNLGWEALKGAGGGYISYRAGNYITNILAKPINPNISILLQNYDSPYPMLTGNAISSAVSGPVPIVADKAKDYYFPQDKK